MTDTETAEDRTRRCLVPVARINLPDEPDVIHLSVYQWLPALQGWGTGMAICGHSAQQGPLLKATVTCEGCLAYRARYERMLTPGYRPEDDDPEALRKRITALHAPVRHMGQTWCGECSVRRSTGPTTEEWVAFIPHPCPTIDVLDSKEIAEGDTDENGAWHSVWLHGKWESLTRRMSTAEREYAADRVASYSRYLAECDSDPERGEPDGLRWWREAGR